MLRCSHYDVLIVGGGFYGCILAATMAEHGASVLLCEENHDIMLRASGINQARVHNGYHYVRSFVTAIRCHHHYSNFIKQFRRCIIDNFVKLYAIPLHASKVTAEQFFQFARNIGAPVARAATKYQKLFNPALVEDVYECAECVFDIDQMRETCRDRIFEHGVDVALDTTVHSVRKDSKGLAATIFTDGTEGSVTASRVFNCSYSQLNALLYNSRLPLIPLKHEITEMVHVEIPDEIQGLGITLVCGPFFSLMPLHKGLYTFSHVRYTPHHSWIDHSKYESAYSIFSRYRKNSNYLLMMKDAARYIPALTGLKPRQSVWELKSVLPSSEMDDSRPILFSRNHGIEGLCCILGSKFDNVYDALDQIEKEYVS
ncbi:MAG TPA: FAD-dependent oxidoreductase [Chthoniobacterales bacterium]